MVFKTKKKSRTIRIGVIILIVYVVVAAGATLKLQKTNAQHELMEIQRSLDVHRDGLQDLIDRGFVESASLRSIVAELKESGQLSREVINKILKCSSIFIY